MSFQEKTTWLVLAAMVLVYGWYFATIAVELGTTAAQDIDYQGTMLFTVVALVVVITIGAIVAAATGGGDDTSDERDKAINRYGEYVGGFVLGAGALGAMALAMIEVEQFWIANAILLALVLSEIVTNITKAILYRRGTFAW